MTEKKMTLTEQRDEWRNLAKQEREARMEAEGMRDIYRADLERMSHELEAAQSRAARLQAWRSDATFIAALILVAFIFLYVVTR